MLWQRDTIQAGAYDDAYSYYRTYGNQMRFLPGAKNEGEIYYATKGKKNETAGVRYTTIGWKVRVFNRDGALIDTIYYKLGGNHMSEIDVVTRDGYEYCLYRVTLENLKSRLSSAGLETLNRPDSNIVFDACISVKRNGVLQGGMTDAGPNWGEVHTSYNGIVHAEYWTEATKESLNSYYNKNVEGLFYEVTLEKGNGIKKVIGEGSYCFGSMVKVQAECEDGYHFENWTGSFSMMNASTSFVMYGNDVGLVANASENNYKVLFDSNGGDGYIPEKKLAYSAKFSVPEKGIEMKDASLSGWKVKENGYEKMCAVGQEMLLSQLVKNLGLEKTDGAEIIFHACWDEGPMIHTEQIYVSLADVVAGKITEAWLAQKAFAYDLEDGEIPYGKNIDNSFYIENYRELDFTKFQEEGSLRKMFCAVDSAGNKTRREIEIHIIDTSIYPKEKIFGRVRFISKKYFWDENKNLITEEMGGLMEDSIWRLDENYRLLLEKLFQ